RGPGTWGVPRVFPCDTEVAGRNGAGRRPPGSLDRRTIVTRRLTFAILLLTLGTGWTAAAPKEYPFAVAPNKAFEKLAEVEKAGHKIALTPDEAALIEDARDGKLDRFSFAEACLIASGVTDAAARKKYLSELDRIEADARKSLDGAKTPRE